MLENIKSIISQEKNIDSTKLTEFKNEIEKVASLEMVFKPDEIEVIHKFLDKVQKGGDSPIDYCNYILNELDADKRKTIAKYIDIFDLCSTDSNNKTKYPQRIEDFDAFLKYRFEGQRRYFSDNSKKYKAAFYKNQKWVLRLTVLIPIIVAVGTAIIQIPDDAQYVKVLSYVFNVFTIICSSIVAFITSNDKLEDNQNNWRLNRESCEKLKQELSLFEGKCGPYEKYKDDKDELERKRLFRERVEKCVEDNVSRFTSLNVDTTKILEDTVRELEAYRKAYPDFKPSTKN